MIIRFSIICLIFCLFLTGCEYFHVYQPPVQQGNIISDKSVARLRPGMSKVAVTTIMGSPVIVNTFDDNRFNYVYEYYERGRKIQFRRVIVQFRNAKVVRIIRR
ncbi:MAG: outer membrane protein assembly factor BamE [Pseudomonadota bacterium]